MLLIHGMSDSPYSMRSLAERLHAEGAWVVGLRVPGHGTAPSGLVDVEWQDMAAAVRIAVRHLRESVANAPLFLVGYSNGGALAVEYALEALEDARPPAAGPPRAAVARDRDQPSSPRSRSGRSGWGTCWVSRSSRGTRSSPSTIPFKYGSFALNAGKQAYLITHEIRTRIERLAARGALGPLSADARLPVGGGRDGLGAGSRDRAVRSAARGWPRARAVRHQPGRRRRDAADARPERLARRHAGPRRSPPSRSVW